MLYRPQPTHEQSGGVIPTTGSVFRWQNYIGFFLQRFDNSAFTVSSRFPNDVADKKTFNLLPFTSLCMARFPE
jgi:hypothetical protein